MINQLIILTTSAILDSTGGEGGWLILPRLYHYPFSPKISMMNSEISTADVAQVKVGELKFEGLKFPDGSYGIAVSQIAKLFSISVHNASRDFKALLGCDFQFIQANTSLNFKAVKALTLYDFESLTLELVAKGNTLAKVFARALIGLSLHQLYCDAFGVKFGAVERQEWLLTRFNTKLGFIALKQQLKQHGLKFSFEFGEFVGTMQSYVGLPNGTRDTANLETLLKLEKIQIQLTELMESGVKPTQALRKVRDFYS
jgi:hypothetical protein